MQPNPWQAVARDGLGETQAKGVRAPRLAVMIEDERIIGAPYSEPLKGLLLLPAMPAQAFYRESWQGDCTTRALRLGLFEPNLNGLLLWIRRIVNDCPFESARDAERSCRKVRLLGLRWSGAKRIERAGLHCAGGYTKPSLCSCRIRRSLRRIGR